MTGVDRLCVVALDGKPQWKVQEWDDLHDSTANAQEVERYLLKMACGLTDGSACMSREMVDVLAPLIQTPTCFKAYSFLVLSLTDCSSDLDLARKLWRIVEDRGSCELIAEDFACYFIRVVELCVQNHGKDVGEVEDLVNVVRDVVSRHCLTDQKGNDVFISFLTTLVENEWEVPDLYEVVNCLHMNVNNEERVHLTYLVLLMLSTRKNVDICVVNDLLKHHGIIATFQSKRFMCAMLVLTLQSPVIATDEKVKVLSEYGEYVVDIVSELRDACILLDFVKSVRLLRKTCTIQRGRIEYFWKVGERLLAELSCAELWAQYCQD